MGKYRILHRLGVGGMSDVYLAFHESLERHVAFKVMRSDLTNSPEHLKRFLQEARAAASMVHPNIVQVYDVGEIQGCQYIAQEYIAGSNLRAYIQRQGALSVEETISILLQVSAALGKSASIGIVHRDIKPDNILLNSDGEVKVADFGLARAFSSKNNLTEVGIALGTPTYMSPEQVQGQTVDSRSDLYSLGVTAYHMLTGRPPFEGDTALSLAVQHVQNKVPPITDLRPDLPQGLVTCIERLLQKKPEDRYASPNELNRVLRKLADELPKPLLVDQPVPLPNVSMDQTEVLSEPTAALQRATINQKIFQERQRGNLLKSLMTVVGLGLVGWLSYAALAWSQPPPLLPEPTPMSAGVERQQTIQGQYVVAMLKDLPAYWNAIEKYFPPQDSANETYNIKSWLHLAWYDLRRGETKSAGQSLGKILQCKNVDPVLMVLVHATAAWRASLIGEKAEMETQKSLARSKFAALPDEQKALIEHSVPQEVEVMIEGF